MTGGILTLAVAGSAIPATAGGQPPSTETTQELPTFSLDLATTAAQSADATQQAALGYQLQDQQEQAAGKAKVEAKKAKTEAERKAKETKERAERAAAKQAAAAEKAREQQRVSRTSERTTLSTTSTNNNSSSNSAPTGTTTAPQTETPPVSSGSGNTAQLISFLKAQVGKAYIPGAMGPSSYDCSGLTSVAFRQVGVTLPRVSQDQSAFGTQVSLSNLQPGDILYWGSSGSAYHVAVYIGGGQFIGAQNSGTGVVQRDMSYDMPTGAVRVL